METNSLSLYRIIKSTPEKLFKAFSDPLALASWLPPHGFLATVELMNFSIEGEFRISFTNFSTGNSHSFGGKFIEIVHNKFIKYTDKFDDPNLTGEITTSVSIGQVSCGVELLVMQEGIPSVIPIEMCYLGWQESLEKLTKLVEPLIPDA